MRLEYTSTREVHEYGILWMREEGVFDAGNTYRVFGNSCIDVRLILWRVNGELLRQEFICVKK